MLFFTDLNIMLNWLHLIHVILRENLCTESVICLLKKYWKVNTFSITKYKAFLIEKTIISSKINYYSFLVNCSKKLILIHYYIIGLFFPSNLELRLIVIIYSASSYLLLYMSIFYTNFWIISFAYILFFIKYLLFIDLCKK